MIRPLKTKENQKSKLDLAQYLNQYIQLVLESLYILAGFKNVFFPYTVAHHPAEKLNGNGIYDSRQHSTHTHTLQIHQAQQPN